MLNAGTKIQKRRAGYTLLLCPICHCVRVFAAYNVRRLPHLYHLPLTEGHHVGGFVVCQDCGLRRAMESVAVESLHQSSDPVTLWALLRPEAQARLLERAEAELALLQCRTQDTGERQAALTRTFLAVEDELASLCRGGQIHVSRRPYHLLAGSLIVSGAILIGFVLARDPSMLSVILAMVGGSLLTLGSTLAYQGFAGRYISRVLLPRLLRGIAPLGPTHQELHRVEQELAARGAQMKRYEFVRKVADELSIGASFAHRT